MRAIPLLALVLAGCGLQSTAAGHISLHEFAIDAPEVIEAGTLEVENTGEFAHTLVVTDEHHQVVLSTDLIAPGDTVAVDLSQVPPGSYSLSCRIVVSDPDGNIVDHFQRGMAATVEVSG